MLTVFARLMLSATAIAPISVTYAWVAYFQGQYLVMAIAAMLATVLVYICVKLLRYVQKHSESLPFRAQAVEPSDAETIGFMLVYLLPLFTDDVSNLNWELWVPLAATFGVIIGTGYGHHFNPLLGILRWHFYRVTSQEGVTYLLITKKHLRRAASVQNVAQLTEYILLDKEG